MRKGWQIACTAVLVFLPKAWGQSDIGVVDIARIFEQYERTAYLEEEFVAKKKFLADEAEKRRTQIEASRKALSAYNPGAPELKQKSEELGEAEIRFEVWSRREEEGLLGAHKESLLRIYNDVRETVGKVAQKRGVNLVVTYDMLTQDAPDSKALRQQILLQKVIYWNPSIDLTDEVLKSLNDEFRRSQGDPGKSAAPAKPAGSKDAAPGSGAAGAPPAAKKPDPKQP